MLKMDNRVTWEVVKKFNMNTLLNMDSLCIDDLLVDSGLFETTGIRDIFQSLCKNILQRDDISLHDLYELTNIKLSVKVFNLTTSTLEFISHDTHPDLSITTLAQMTTAIPLFFKPVPYLESIYCDGGFRQGYPYGYDPSPQYLGIKVKGGCGIGWAQEMPLFNTIYSLITGTDERPDQGKTDIRIIDIEPNLGLDFDIDDATKQQVVDHAYRETIKHIHTHFI
jgi:hypothetical protein